MYFALPTEGRLTVHHTELTDRQDWRRRSVLTALGASITLPPAIGRPAAKRTQTVIDFTGEGP